ncbi:hypothetical protein MUK42_32296 [Musa troglodytarum]|uniref:Uncharacterized protein n=1 Tax=Musa troglodytarum TaxID=320322 RepID=A0A9E7I119_9LILI|nr:hypothetical protein MUK42_32296 [Musa troglodytarum]URE43710.1 hypothetical protein MUK42_32296 [Musa troglodytarum]
MDGTDQLCDLLLREHHTVQLAPCLVTEKHILSVFPSATAEEPQTDRSHPHPTPSTTNSAVTPQVPGISGFPVSPLILP